MYTDSSIYVIFCVFLFVNKKKALDLKAVLLLLLSVGLIYFLIRYPIMYLHQERSELYASTIKMIVFSIMLLVINFSIVVFLIKCFAWRIERSKFIFPICFFQYANILWNSNLLVFLISPVLFDFPILMRVLRILSLFNVILILNIFFSCRRFRVLEVLTLFAYLLMIILVFIVPVADLSFIPMLRDNYLNVVVL